MRATCLLSLVVGRLVTGGTHSGQARGGASDRLRMGEHERGDFVWVPCGNSVDGYNGDCDLRENANGLLHHEYAEEYEGILYERAQILRVGEGGRVFVELDPERYNGARFWTEPENLLPYLCKLAGVSEIALVAEAESKSESVVQPRSLVQRRFLAAPTQLVVLDLGGMRHGRVAKPRYAANRDIVFVDVFPEGGDYTAAQLQEIAEPRRAEDEDRRRVFLDAGGIFGVAIDVRGMIARVLPVVRSLPARAA